ncbi:MAG: class I tRNA ligase family protein [Candidatus Daviesbacteria bacterium]|nr:class I tRNA ligase family protein [Candidatus Daviesbacteria bacterium]
MKKYIPSDIEPKWQKKWEEDRLYEVDLSDAVRRQYILIEFSYPSGDLHMGHWFAFAVPDILARFRRMQGYNVFFPNGFDAFGLPAENAAIKKGIHPRDWTLSNIEKMKQQFKTMGASFNWENEVITCLPEYYKWNQWIFLKMLGKGIAYRGKALANWCPNCQTVLANENVEAGKCWRCGTEVIQKQVEQWFLKLTEYADRLLWKDNPIVDWPKAVREGQNNWIGKSEGMILDFDGVEVFTTRPETTDGATFLVLAPEHSMIGKFTIAENKNDVDSYIKQVKNKTELERKEGREKTGVFTGSFVKNPVSNKEIPVWVADYILMGYGTGAIMAVPYADERDKEFAEKFDLPIIKTSFKAKPQGKQKVNYHIHDWSISRQRYWGTPIPVIYCDTDGMVSVPEKDLPVELPYEVDYAPKGKPPLATAEDWVEVSCPKCGKSAKREVETMDTFVDSSWYFFRYLDPKNSQQIFKKEVVEKWLPLDIYFGGAEHTLGHTLYSRFFTKFFHDLGLISFEEYARKRVNRGLILGPDGQKMSKSRGNVVNPDEQVKSYGADAVRLYLAFIGPYAGTVAPWDNSGLNGVYHFLQRVWGLADKIGSNLQGNDLEARRMMHKTIKRVTEDIEANKFNTAVAGMMEWLNYLSRKDQISQDEYRTLLFLLAPFAPHITEELWEKISQKYSIHQASWPVFDEKSLEEEELPLIVQVNGKVRDVIMIQKDIISNKEVIEKKGKGSVKVAKYLEGTSVKKIVYIEGKVLNFIV